MAVFDAQKPNKRICVNKNCNFISICYRQECVSACLPTATALRHQLSTII